MEQECASRENITLSMMALLCSLCAYFSLCLQEYGITAEEKAEIARLIGTPLVRKIRGDLRHQSGDFVHQLNPE